MKNLLDKNLATQLLLLPTVLVAQACCLWRTDPITGAKIGWFGAKLPKNAPSSWNPLANPPPTPTPQLSKEYIYASGSRLLAVEDANANAAAPADLAYWRPSNGVWNVMSGGTGGSQPAIQAWGIAGR